MTDLERSMAFYARLRFTASLRKDIHGRSGEIRVAMLEHEKLTLELYQLDPGERQAIAQRTDGHIDHIALDVKDIDRAYQEICAAGLEVLEDPAPVFLPFWAHGVRFFTVRGRDGEKVEFNQFLREGDPIP